ncbi:hypothetical protein [Paenibacillus algicola]|nr:hypothetical protein [Paenibacillus algicola]
MGIALIISLALMSGCESSTKTKETNIQPKDIQTYNMIVKEVYNDNIPFAQDGIFYTDSGKIIVGLKEENENTKQLKEKLETKLKDKVKFIEVEYSRSDLNQALNKLKTKLKEIDDAGIKMTHIGVGISEQKVNFVINEFDKQQFKDVNDVEKFIENLVTKQEKEMLDITYNPGMKTEVGG